MGVSNSQRDSSRVRTVMLAGATVAVFLAFVVWVWLAVGPELVYYQQGPVFLSISDLVRNPLVRPGGVAEYVSVFLTQFCLFPWLGALLITGVSVLVCAGTYFLLRPLTGEKLHPAVYLVPAVLLAMLHSQYDYHLTNSVGLLGVLVLAGVMMRLPVHRTVWRVAVFVVLAVVVFATTGGMVVLFGVLCGLFEVVKGRRVVGLLCLVVAAALPLGYATFDYTVGLDEAFQPLLPYTVETFSRPSITPILPPRDIPAGLLDFRPVLQLVLVAYFPVVMVLVGPGRRVLGWVAGRLRRSKVRGVSTRKAGTWSVLSFCVFLVAGGVLTFWSLDGNARTRLEISRCVSRGDWQGALDGARKYPPELYDAFVMHDVNRALYHTGRLPYEMFAYPQKRVVASRKDRLLDGLVLYTFRVRHLQQTTAKSSALFCDLGQVNLADRGTNVCIETLGERPELLERLVRVNVLRGRPDVARVLLGRMGRNALFRGRAEELLRRLNEDPSMNDDPEVRRLRPLVIRKDYGWSGVDAAVSQETILIHLLEANRTNRMAFEYLMAYYMLTRQLDRLVAEIGRLDDFDYPDIPRHYEEAILMYQTNNPGAVVDLHGRRISGETLQRLRDFSRLFVAWQRAEEETKKTVRRELEKRHGDTYFYYQAFGYSVTWTKISYVDTITGASEWQAGPL